MPGEGGAPEAKVVPRTEEGFRARISLEVRRPVPAADFLGETGVLEGKRSSSSLGKGLGVGRGRAWEGAASPRLSPRRDGRGSWC